MWRVPTGTEQQIRGNLASNSSQTGNGSGVSCQRIESLPAGSALVPDQRDVLAAWSPDLDWSLEIVRDVVWWQEAFT